MRIQNQSFPHPVLGIKDDISGSFKVNFSWSCDRAYYYLSPIFNLNQGHIEKLIDSDLARFIIHVECGNTFLRKSFSTQSRSPEFRINADFLRDKVEVTFYVCAVNSIIDYEPADAHIDYQDLKFQIEKGDILAYGGNCTFLATKNYESLRAVSSIMEIKKGIYNEGPAKVNFLEDKIVLELSSQNYLTYNNHKIEKKYESFFHCSLVLPILFRALVYIKDDDEDYRDKKWFIVIKKRIEDEKLLSMLDSEEQHFTLIQKLFGNPLNRLFDSIEKLNEDYDNNG